MARQSVVRIHYTRQVKAASIMPRTLARVSRHRCASQNAIPRGVRIVQFANLRTVPI
jgi:hypothetical protein